MTRKEYGLKYLDSVTRLGTSEDKTLYERLDFIRAGKSIKVSDFNRLSFSGDAFLKIFCYLDSIDGFLWDTGEVVIPRGATVIEERIFYNTNITSVVIPDTVYRLEEGAFENCKQLRSVELPDSVEIIDGLAFCDCNSLMTVKIGSGIKFISSAVFFGCSSNLKIVTESREVVRRLGDRDFNIVHTNGECWVR